ncbi:MAG: hypothetical protein DRN26_00020 [Thermoplasmata archaeon]|nr:MAG: hypothetical protein DRN26_00020 [Thermoplasmata archaeon]
MDGICVYIIHALKRVQRAARRVAPFVVSVVISTVPHTQRPKRRLLRKKDAKAKEKVMTRTCNECPGRLR